MSNRLEEIWPCDDHVNAVGILLRAVVNDIVLCRNDETYLPEFVFKQPGFEARWGVQDEESGDWHTCQIEVQIRRILCNLNDLTLACEVVPGVYGTRARLRPTHRWRTVITMNFDVEAAIDDRAVNYLISFDPEFF